VESNRDQSVTKPQAVKKESKIRDSDTAVDRKKPATIRLTCKKKEPKPNRYRSTVTKFPIYSEKSERVNYCLEKKNL
jgi:hypothetical protein